MATRSKNARLIKNKARCIVESTHLLLYNFIMKTIKKSFKIWCEENKRIDLLSQWSEENSITPDQVSYGSDTNIIIWECRQGHKYNMTPNKMTRKITAGCPYCSGQRILVGYNDLASQYPEIAKEWHPFKNEELTPALVSAHSNKSYWWLCPNGHEYYAKVNGRTRKRSSGCPYCAASNNKLLRGYNDLETKFPDIAKEWHPFKNGKLRPSDVLPGTAQKVWWICPKGHEYQATSNSRTGSSHSGCPYCAGRKVLAGFNDIESQFPSIAKEWHPTKNGSATPDKVGKGSHSKYWWICPIGHEYQASPENRTKNSGKGTACPICAKESQTSFPEQSIYFYIRQIYPKTENRAVIQGKELDIFIPELSVGIEYDGWRFHNHNTVVLEEKKDAFFKQHGIMVIRVKEYRGKPYKEGEDIIWIDERKDQFSNIRYALIHIAECIKISTDVFSNIDLNKDSNAIMAQYYVAFKENSIATRFPKLIKEWSSKNDPLKPEQFSYGSGKKVWWICPKGHEDYKMAISYRTSLSHPAGCPVCGGQKLMKGYNDLESQFPLIAKEWHPEKNENLKPDMIMAKVTKKVWWQCPKGHTYYASVAGRTRLNAGCPYCSGHKVIEGKTDLATLFPDIAKEWHHALNGELKPNAVAPFSHNKVWWKCKNQHDYQMPIASRTRGSGCPYCSGRKVLKGYNDLQTRFPDIAKWWHPTKNEELLPDMGAPYSTKKVWWMDKNGNAIQRRIDATVTMMKKQNKPHEK